MRVLILWADEKSANLGVRVLAQGTEELVRRAFPEASFEWLNYGSQTAPIPVGDWRRVTRERLLRRSPFIEWLRGFDLAVDTRAGDSFADIYGLRRLWTQSLLAELVVEAGVPVVLGPQTIGPFRTRRGRTLGAWSLRRASVALARDSSSAVYAEALGRPVDAISTDVVFALPRPARSGERDVMLNISGLLWRDNPHVESASYRRSVLNVAHGVLDRGRRLTLLAHVLDSPVPDNDVPAIREFARVLDRDVEILVPDSLDHVRQAAASARVVLGSRMHACLNALSVGTPAVPLAYSRKFEPLLRDLGWPHTVDLRGDADAAAGALALLDRDLAADVPAVLGRAESLLRPAVTILGRLG